MCKSVYNFHIMVYAKAILMLVSEVIKRKHKVMVTREEGQGLFCLISVNGVAVSLRWMNYFYG